MALTTEQFDEHYLRYHKLIARLLHTMTQAEPETFEDLMQESLIVLWEFDPASVKSNEAACIYNAVRNRVRHIQLSKKRSRKREMEWVTGVNLSDEEVVTIDREVEKAERGRLRKERAAGAKEKAGRAPRVMVGGKRKVVKGQGVR